MQSLHDATDSRNGLTNLVVMTGLLPAIHDFLIAAIQDAMLGTSLDEPGHDEQLRAAPTPSPWPAKTPPR